MEKWKRNDGKLGIHCDNLVYYILTELLQLFDQLKLWSIYFK